MKKLHQQNARIFGFRYHTETQIEIISDEIERTEERLETAKGKAKEMLLKKLSMLKARRGELNASLI